MSRQIGGGRKIHYDELFGSVRVLVGCVLIFWRGIELDHEFECFFLCIAWDQYLDDTRCFCSEIGGHGPHDHGLDAGFDEHVACEHGLELGEVLADADWFRWFVAHGGL